MAQKKAWLAIIGFIHNQLKLNPEHRNQMNNQALLCNQGKKS